MKYAHAAATGHSSQCGAVVLHVSFPCSRSRRDASASTAAFFGSAAIAAARDDRYVLE